MQGDQLSAMAIDHEHEQNNGTVRGQGDGGATGLTQDENSLHLWIVSGQRL